MLACASNQSLSIATILHNMVTTYFELIVLAKQKRRDKYIPKYRNGRQDWDWGRHTMYAKHVWEMRGCVTLFDHFVARALMCLRVSLHADGWGWMLGLYSRARWFARVACNKRIIKYVCFIRVCYCAEGFNFSAFVYFAASFM